MAHRRAALAAALFVLGITGCDDAEERERAEPTEAVSEAPSERPLGLTPLEACEQVVAAIPDLGRNARPDEWVTAAASVTATIDDLLPQSGELATAALTDLLPAAERLAGVNPVNIRAATKAVRNFADAYAAFGEVAC